MYQDILDILDSIKFRPICHPRKAVVGKGYTQTFGYIMAPYKGFRPCAANVTYPDAWSKLRDFGNSLCPVGMKWNAITINKNLQTPRHRDAYNVDDSLFISIGHFEGGELVIENDDEPDTIIPKNTPITFDGHAHYHYTKPFTGTRYSLIFFKTNAYDLMPPSIGPCIGGADKFLICVPSYHRPDTFRNRTYQLLKRHNLLHRTLLFLQSREDEEAQKEFDIDMVVGCPRGLPEINQFIQQYLPLNTPYVHMDDDIRDLYHYDGSKLVSAPLESVLFQTFNEMRKNNSVLGGFYPVKNAGWMKGGISTDLRFILGSLFCCFVFRPEHKLAREFLQFKLDFERTILAYIHSKSVVRMNDQCIWADPYCRNVDRVGIENAANIELKRLYGEYIKCMKRHKKGTTSVILRR